MGWYIGQNEEVEVVTTNGFTTKTAYIGLNDVYFLTYMYNGTYRVSIHYSAWSSKSAKQSGMESISISELPHILNVEITDVEFGTPLGNDSIATFLISKFESEILKIKPEWVGKLIRDF